MANLANVRNCPVCRKIYMEVGLGMCRDCLAVKEAKANDVLRYVREHPKSTLEEVVEAIGVDVAIVNALIKEGRLEEVGFAYSYPCAKCGKPIMRGRVCEACKEGLQKSLEKAKQKIKEHEKEAKLKRHIDFLKHMEEEKAAKAKKEKKPGKWGLW